jgi:hypothetical protein
LIFPAKKTHRLYPPKRKPPNRYKTCLNRNFRQPVCSQYFLQPLPGIATHYDISTASGNFIPAGTAGSALIPFPGMIAIEINFPHLYVTILT